jgi:hypothetical protein
MQKKMYDSLDAFRSELARARSMRDGHEQDLSQRWDQLKDPSVRGLLLKDAAVDVIRSTGPGRHIHDLLHGRFSASMVSTLGMAFANTQHGFVKRMAYSGISLLLGRLMRPDKAPASSTLSHVASGIGQFVQRLRARQAARNDARTEQEVEHDI